MHGAAFEQSVRRPRPAQLAQLLVQLVADPCDAEIPAFFLPWCGNLRMDGGPWLLSTVLQKFAEGLWSSPGPVEGGDTFA